LRAPPALRRQGKADSHGATPPFVKVAIDAWTAAARLSEGPLFRRVRRRKYPEKTPVALTERMISSRFGFYSVTLPSTERYLGSRQNLKEAVNDRLGLD